MTNVFGFSTEPKTGGDFLPIIKYDARAGRMFRIDRIDTGNGFESNQVDITDKFSAQVDFEFLETGWIEFTPGSPPSFVLVKWGEPLPGKPPTGKFKHGVRFMVKLASSCADDKPRIREMAGTSNAMLNGIAAVAEQYQRERNANPGKLPVIRLVKTFPVKTGSGLQSSTNYHPVFEIIGWAPRGDLVPQPKSANGTAVSTTNGATPPSTGSTHAPAPGQVQQPQQVQQRPASVADDFG